MKKLLFTVFILVNSLHAICQGLGNGSDGSPNISGIINSYSKVNSINTVGCYSQITVDSILNFQPNDLVLIIQIQGAKIDTSNTSNYGTIQNLNSTGNFEFFKINSITGNTITSKGALNKTYDIVNGKIQLIRVPQYNSPTISGLLTCKKWDGLKGGVLVLDAIGTITLNDSITTSSKGFRGGIIQNGGTQINHQTDYRAFTSASYFSNKGEGIAGYGFGTLTSGKGAPANGGGGGNAVNAGGGGGGNYGCGGLGGQGFTATTYPGNCALSQGIGGHFLTYNVGSLKLYLGGGGGAGQANDNQSFDGGDGGGIIIINANSIVGNNKMINANGSGVQTSGIDGSSGGGAAGCILLNIQNYSGLLSVNAIGGHGGNSTNYLQYYHGPGGGGGGGIIILKNASTPIGLTTNVNGGLQGLCNGNNSLETDGCIGGVLYNFNLSSIGGNNVHSSQTLSICQNDTATLQLNSSAQFINWNPTTNLSCTNCNAPKAYPSSNTIYIATDSLGHCFSRDTFKINVVACQGLCKGTFNFNGINEVQLPLPDTSYYSANGFTWECWFKAPHYNTQDSSLQPGHSLLIVEDAVACEDIVINFGWTGVKRTYLSFVVDGPGLCGNRDLNPCIYKPSAGFIPNKWYHVAGVKSYTANTTKLYVNGILVDTKTNTKTPLLRDIRTRISSIPVGADSGFVGKIDEVRMWNYARTSTEVFSTYNTCLNGNEAGLVTYYKANEGKGLTAYDATTLLGYSDGSASVNTIWDSIDNAPIVPRNCITSFTASLQSNSPICNKDTFKINVLGLIPSSCKYVWTGANNFTSTQKNISLINAKQGKYFLTITDTINKCNQVYFDSMQLVMLPPSTFSFSTSICQGNTYTLPSGLIVSSGGTYHDTIPNHLGCDSIITIQLMVKNKSTSSFSSVICKGKNYVTPSGKVLINAGVYNDTILNYRNCDSIITIQLQTKDSSLQIINATICNGKNYTLPNGSVVNGVGSYVLKYTNYIGCDSTIVVNLMVLSNSASIINAIICQGNTYTLPSGKIVSNANIYHDTIPNHLNCDSTITINLSVKNNTSSSTTASICQGNTYTLPNGLIVSSGGTYHDTILNYFGCDSIITIQLTVKNKSVASFNAVICKGNNFVAPSGKIFTTAGNYFDTILNHLGCDSIITIQLSTKDSSLTIVSAIICEGDSYTLPNGNIIGNAGAYTIKFINSLGCDSTIKVYLNVSTKPIVNIGSDTAICNHSKIRLSASNNNIYYLWNTLSVDSFIIVSESGLYSVKVVNPPCTAVYDSIFIASVICDCNILIPNSFTPNDDGENDFFYPIKTCEFEIEDYEFKIFNRWGENIFITNNFHEPWDGTYKGIMQEIGTYIYLLKYKNMDTGKSGLLKGSCHLIR